MNKYAVITAKNEEDTIRDVVDQLVADGWQVVVINDGSTDDTAWNALTAGAQVVHQYPSQGIGKSLLRAWKHAYDNGADYIVQLDAGGSHCPEQALELLSVLIMADAELVIGSRFTESGGFGIAPKKAEYIGRKWRALASMLAAVMLNFAAHQHISDWTSGYRCFSRRAIEELLSFNYYQPMHAWQIEVLGKAIERDFYIVETPITYTAGRSSLRLKGVSDAVLEWLCLFNR